MYLKKILVMMFGIASMSASAIDNKPSAEIFPLIEESISTANDSPTDVEYKPDAKSRDGENSLDSNKLSTSESNSESIAQQSTGTNTDTNTQTSTEDMTELDSQSNNKPATENLSEISPSSTVEELQKNEVFDTNSVEQASKQDNSYSSEENISEAQEKNEQNALVPVNENSIVPTDIQTKTSNQLENSPQVLDKPAAVETTKAEVVIPVQDEKIKSQFDATSMEAVKKSNSFSVEQKSSATETKNIAEKAYETIKEVLKTDTESRSKILDEKKSKPKDFPPNEILTIDSDNPKKFNGLPKYAIEKVPGLAKDKSATFLTLKDTVQTSIITNPEVLQSYKSFEGAVKEADAAWGRYLPSVDLNAYYGQENRNDPLVSRDPGRLGAAFTRSQASLSLRQMLFDGFFTKTEVERLSRTSRARLFELEEQSNATALESIRAYTDLLRFRRLTELTEDNYVNHKVIYEQLVIKANAGVGKKSDVEQAKSRLALAEYNMTVEGANLHDIEARFQKVVGFLPPEEIDSGFPINREIPNDAKLAINKAQLNNPKLLATIEDALSQQALLDNKDAAFMPKVDLRMRADRGNDLNSFNGYHGNDVAEVVVSWNLFNGNSDVNFKRKERALLEAAINRRDKFCRDIRLELEIAYNDIKKLTEQYNYLESRAIAIEKARDAYRKQFEIGQRTLIDLLNTENELFEAKRLLTNIQNDLNFAYARTHYQMGSLLSILDVTRYASTTTAPRPSSLSELGSNIEVCPAEAPTPYRANKKNLDSRALQFVNTPKDEDGEKPKNLNKDFKELTQ